MSFNPDTNEQAQEVIFSCRPQKSSHRSLTFNGTSVIQKMLNKVNKTIEFLRKIQKILPRPSLITIYKYFVRSHLDYGDIVYDQTYNFSFHQKIESFQ